jgi:hypothetical protein
VGGGEAGGNQSGHQKRLAVGVTSRRREPCLILSFLWPGPLSLVFFLQLIDVILLCWFNYLSCMTRGCGSLHDDEDDTDDC